ncbi:TetR/AcrR family transcriptional regulator [Nonomuraea dietziae]|uniref:TetR/AcrR family transcriptional regulator n=1 Tax=Nonomuraea dietziae TaxID=65515 RepID=UPI0033E08BE2
MARGNTRERIQQVAKELFIAQGVQRTSLQEIADRLGITKPALYYHFDSREELVRSIIVPLLDDGRDYLATVETDGETDARALLGGFFDFHYKHRDILMLAVREMTTLADLGLLETVTSWRERLGELLVGEDASLAARVRAVVALGGLADCAWAFSDVPADELRPVAVDAALSTLGLS